MPPRRQNPGRYRRWDTEIDNAALRAMFDDGSADPNRTTGTDYMNEVFQNNQDKFGHIEHVRNFHSAYRRVAAEWVTENATRGQRRREANDGANNVGGAAAAAAAAAADNEDNDMEGTLHLIFLTQSLRQLLTLL